MAFRTRGIATMGFQWISSRRLLGMEQHPAVVKTRRSRRARYSPLTEALEERSLMAGFFQAPVPLTVGGTDPSSIQVADFNRDGRPDLAVLTGTQVSVLVNNGTGGFSPLVSLAPTAGLTFRSIAVGDMNRDGQTDITAVSTSAATLEVKTLLNTGGTFTPAA